MPPRRSEADPVRTLSHAPQSETGGSADSRPVGTAEPRPPVAPRKRSQRAAMFTSTPETTPPQLLCPSCDRPLMYRQTVISGVKPIERWDYFECRSCGPYVYRDRTRKLRPTA
jgi:hypothetical protein